MTTTEEATQLFHKAGEIAGWKPGVGNPLVINYLRIFADLVKAEENEACAKACEDRAGTMSMFATTRDAKTHNAAVKGDASTIRARVK